MPCYRPIHGFTKLGGGFTTSAQYSNGNPMTVPCGRCIGCRLDHGRMWAIRMVHEGRYHENTCFITLTYSDEHLPQGQTLVKSDAQKFLKRLRKAGHKFRYYLCGEYGTATLRPHYHAIMFGYRPDDLKMHKQGDGHNTYTSSKLENHWGLGFTTVGELTPETCAYTARYVTKKISGPPAETHYQRLNPSTGEISQVIPEFSLMSRRPGIGHDYYLEHGERMFEHDNVVHQRNLAPVPAYYDKLLAKTDLPWLENLKYNRTRRAKENRHETTAERLAVREECRLAKTRHQTRGN